MQTNLQVSQQTKTMATLGDKQTNHIKQHKKIQIQKHKAKLLHVNL